MHLKLKLNFFNQNSNLMHLVNWREKMKSLYFWDLKAQVPFDSHQNQPVVVFKNLSKYFK